MLKRHLDMAFSGHCETSRRFIDSSIQDWADSPVSTTIETLPIADIRLPRVTVCPPRNTFTNLNHDLTTLEQVTLSNATREQLTKYAVRLIQDRPVSDA